MPSEWLYSSYRIHTLFSASELWFITKLYYKKSLFFKPLFFLSVLLFMGVDDQNIYPRVSLNCLILAQGYYVSFFRFCFKNSFEDKAKIFQRRFYNSIFCLSQILLCLFLSRGYLLARKPKNKENQTSIIILNLFAVIRKLKNYKL